MQNNTKTLKQRFNNFTEIINFPAYYCFFYSAKFLNPIVNLFVRNQKLKIITTTNEIYFKNKVYLRGFVCRKLTIIILKFFYIFYFALHFYKTYLL